MDASLGSGPGDAAEGDFEAESAELANVAGYLPTVLAPPATGPPGSYPDRTSPVGDDELTNSKIRCYVTASPPALLGARKMEISIRILVCGISLG
jgi:hypothetical protein